MGTDAVVQGTVKDEFGNPLDGATVSAQTSTDADHVVVHSTTSTTNGSYAMHLPPGPYCIVAYKGKDCDYTDVYGPSCQTIVAESDTVHTVDFTSLSSHLVLTPAISTGKLTGHVTGAEVVTLSFRQSGVCPSGCDWIEVASVLSGGTDPYCIVLPPGTSYRVAAFTDCETKLTVAANVTAYTDTTLSPFEFSPSPYL